jgi:hypothetical protein
VNLPNTAVDGYGTTETGIIAACITGQASYDENERERPLHLVRQQGIRMAKQLSVSTALMQNDFDAVLRRSRTFTVSWALASSSRVQPPCYLGTCVSSGVPEMDSRLLSAMAAVGQLHLGLKSLVISVQKNGSILPTDKVQGRVWRI